MVRNRQDSRADLHYSLKNDAEMAKLVPVTKESPHRAVQGLAEVTFLSATKVSAT